MNEESMHRDAIEWAREAGALVRAQLGKAAVELKGEIDLVTAADRMSERFLVESIRARYPSHSICAEEGGSDDREADFRWILDPIDGTTNFAHQIPHFSVLIALQRMNADGYETISAVTYDPMRDECFDARLGEGARLNGETIRVSGVSQLIASTGATGFAYGRWTQLDDNHREFCALNLLTQGLRRLGSAGLDLAWVACGRFDFYWEVGLKPWDVAGGALLVTEAGGHVTDTLGQHFAVELGDLACGGPVHEALIRALALARASPINDRVALAGLRPSVRADD